MPFLENNLLLEHKSTLAKPKAYLLAFSDGPAAPRLTRIDKSSLVSLLDNSLVLTLI